MPVCVSAFRRSFSAQIQPIVGNISACLWSYSDKDVARMKPPPKFDLIRRFLDSDAIHAEGIRAPESRPPRSSAGADVMSEELQRKRFLDSFFGNEGGIRNPEKGG